MMAVQDSKIIELKRKLYYLDQKYSLVNFVTDVK